MTNRVWIELKILTMALSAAVLLQPSQGFSTAVSCADAVKNLDLDRSETSPLDSQSIDQKIQNLAELKLSLDLAKIEGRASAQITTLEVNFRNKEHALVDYLEKNGIMTRRQLVEKIKQQIAVLQGIYNRTQKEEASQRKDHERIMRESTFVDGRHAIFNKVEPGDFTMGAGENQLQVKLTTMPEIMASPVTQIIYKKVADLFYARFPEREQINPYPSAHKGETRPVDSVSYVDVERWTDALNALSAVDEPELKSLIPGHKKGMRYSGFMTEAQREYLMKMARTKDGESIDEMVEKQEIIKLTKYAVSGRSKEDGSVLVDAMEPLFINGQEFYGLVGNVWEWTADAWDGKAPLKGGTDPISNVGPFRVIRGGGWSFHADYLHSAFRTNVPPNSQANDVGFRLVRIVE